LPLPHPPTYRAQAQRYRERHVSIGEWLVLALACGAGIIGLLLASGGEGTLYVLGLVLFVAAVIYAFVLIKRYFDRLDRARG
jgi:hypothetical protein